MRFKYLLPALIFGFAITVSAGGFEQAESYRIQGNHAAALTLYIAAATAGHAAANHWAGIYYFEGYGVDKNTVEAAKYFLVGARMGVEDSMIYLAKIYLKGEGLPKDCARARYWITRATRGEVSQDWETELRSCA